MTHSEYTNYFRTLCKKHKDLQHSDTEKHFARIVLSQDELGQTNLEEFISGQRSSLVAPFMILASAENLYEDNLSDNVKKHFAGMFWMLTTSNEEFDKEEEAYDQMEQIAEQILAKIRFDFSQKLYNRHYTFQETTIRKVGQIDAFLGVLVSFQFFTTANQALAYDATNWNA